MTYRTCGYCVISLAVIVGSAIGFAGCGSSSSGTAPTSSASEVATTAASGSVNAGDSTIAMLDPIPFQRSPGLQLIQSAYADNVWICGGPTVTEGGSTVTAYNTVGGTYAYTPGSCTADYDNGATGSASWNGSWTLAYNTSCTVTGLMADFKIGKQTSGCILTRTAPTGITRSITGPDGNQYAITHNTDGAGTGYNSSLSPTNAGVLFQCTAGSGPCTAGTITINGSHLTGTYNGLTYWDHTVMTGTPLAISVSTSGSTTTKTITGGTIVVQHNLLKTTSTSTVSSTNPLVYNKAQCCFPVSGSITTTYSGGSLDGKTESITFDGSSCGIGTLTNTSGTTSKISMIHCI